MFVQVAGIDTAVIETTSGTSTTLSLDYNRSNSLPNANFSAYPVHEIRMSFTVLH